MYGILYVPTFEWFLGQMSANVGQYSIHGAYGYIIPINYTYIPRKPEWTKSEVNSAFLEVQRKANPLAPKAGKKSVAHRFPVKKDVLTKKNAKENW